MGSKHDQATREASKKKGKKTGNASAKAARGGEGADPSGKNGSREPAAKKQIHTDDPSYDDTLLEEIEETLLNGDDEPGDEEVLTAPAAKEAGGDDGSRPTKNSEAGEVKPGTILVPRIPPRGITVDRLVVKKGKPKVKRSAELVAVHDDRTDALRKLGRRHYLQLIMPLHVELLKCQNWIKDHGHRVVVLFEGRDAAGKGGTIKRFIEHMNPRGCRVVALDKPTSEERGQWYFQRYVRHLPTSGEIVLFDRSWYNRAMVERVMGFAHDDAVREFLRSVPEFERMLIRSGIKILKFYFSVSKQEQNRRFQKRLNDPLKQWKLSPVDLESQGKWDDYTKAKEDMFFYTSTADSPWTIIKSDDKKRARINAMRHYLSHLGYPKDYPHMMDPDRRITRTVEEELGVED